MMKKIRTVHWLVVLLVLGLAVGLIVSCGGDDDDDDTQTLTVELAWTNAVNMDLQIQEPTGETVDALGTGPTAVSIGDNNCGFGTNCDPTACANLACDTREKIEVRSATTGTYTIFVENNDLADELVSTYITVPRSQVQTGEAYYMVIVCNVPASSVQPIATVVFPNSVISGEISGTGAATCTVTESTFR